MKQELTWGTAAAVAIVAAVGITSQSGSKPATPQSSGRQTAEVVASHHMITVALGENGEISNVIDDQGGPTAIKPRVTPKVAEFP